jgi:hypothetical protein
MDPLTTVYGSMITNMAREKRNGTTTLSTRELTSKATNTDTGATSGLTAQNMKGNGLKTGSKDKESTSGTMDVSSWATGSTTTCTVRVFTLGLTAENTKVSTTEIRNTGVGSTSGLMVESTMVNGKTASNMVWAFTQLLMARLARRASGKKAKEKNGLTKKICKVIIKHTSKLRKLGEDCYYS